MNAAPQGNAFAGHEAWARLGFVPGQTMRIFGMRRSGNHAIINWLQRNAPNGHALFMNNCKRGKDPFATFASMEIDAKRAPHRKARKNLAGICSKAGDGAMLLLSYEDSSPIEFSAERPISGPFDEQLVDQNVFIYRSYLNWIASLAKKLSANDGYSYARQASILLRSTELYTRILQQVSNANELGIVPICYDDWASDDGYRAALLGKLGMPCRDNTRGDVQPYGGGSSFQKMTETVDELQTDRRWLQMSGDPGYQSVLAIASRDPALMASVTRYFPRDAAVLARIANHQPLPQEVFQ